MAIQTIKLPDGREIAITEWLHWPIFSTIEGEGGIGAVNDPLNLGVGAAINLKLFTYVVGQQIPQAKVSGGTLLNRNSTESDTNQVARSKMNQDEAFLGFGMTYEVTAIGNDTRIPNLPNNVQAVDPIFTGTNLRRLQLYTMYELNVGAGISKPQARAPLSYYGQGLGAYAWGSGDELSLGAATVNLGYGTGAAIPSPQNQRRWQLPIYIHGDQVMYARLWSPQGQIPGLSQNFAFKGYIDGLKKRPVA